jgi:hypothetical protein
VNAPGSLSLLGPMMYDNLPSATQAVSPTCVTETGSARPSLMTSILASSPLIVTLSSRPAPSISQKQAVARWAQRIGMIERA